MPNAPRTPTTTYRIPEDVRARFVAAVKARREKSATAVVVRLMTEYAEQTEKEAGDGA